MTDNRSDIIDATVTLMDSQGVSVSTAKIASQAKVSNGTIFHYFPTKQSLIDAVYVQLKTELVTHIGLLNETNPPKEQLRQVWQRFASWAMSHPERHRVAQLLAVNGVVTPSIAANIDAMFEPYNTAFTELASKNRLADVPLSYINKLLTTQLELAVASELDAAQLDRAYEMAWNSIIIHNPDSETEFAESGVSDVELDQS